MKKDYELSKLKKRTGEVKVDTQSSKVPISLRLDGGVLSELKTEATRLGIPYQTLMGSVLHRYVRGELLDPKALDLRKAFRR